MDASVNIGCRKTTLCTLAVCMDVIGFRELVSQIDNGLVVFFYYNDNNIFTIKSCILN